MTNGSVDGRAPLALPARRRYVTAGAFNRLCHEGSEDVVLIGSRSLPRVENSVPTRRDGVTRNA